ncbi:MAG: extracellular solute-binding protein family 5 [Aeromicrobium sp.]|nr:extracellular solute-binding protein family 5 [Aeromicrobium sp.]
MRSRPVRLITAMVVAALALAVATPGSASAQTPRPGGTLRYLWLAEAPDLDPVNTAVANVSVGFLERFAIFDALIIETPPSGDLEMRIAESMQASSPTVWTLKIRKGIKFSDGTTLDAAAVKFNWDRISSTPTSPGRATMKNVRTVDLTGPLSLRISLSKADTLFDRRLARSAMTVIGSPTAIQKSGRAFGTQPVGAGAYLLDDWRRNDQVVLVKNPQYYGKTYLDRIIIRRVADETQRNNTLNAGGADMMYTADVSSATKQVKTKRFSANRTSVDGGNQLQFHMSKAPFNDVRARRAVALAFDVNAMNKALWEDQADVARTFSRPGSSLYSNIPFPKYDPVEAQRLFDALAKEGKPVNFTIMTGASQGPVAQWLQSQLASFDNVSVKLRILPSAQAAAESSAGNYQVVIGNHRTYDPETGLSDYVYTGGIRNSGGYNSGVVNNAFQAYRGTLDRATRKRSYETIQRELVKDLPIFLFTRLESINIYRTSTVHGVSTVADGVPRWDRIWIG